MRVLVLDGNQNQAVAAVRSLGRAGHRVGVGAADGWSKAGWSRYAGDVFRYPDPREDVEAFVAALATIASKVSPTLILPMTERTTLPISYHRERLLRVGARLVLPSHDIVCRAFDKVQTIRLAASLGVATPATWEIDSAPPRDLAYPAVLKPRASEELLGNRVRATGRPEYVGSDEELEAALGRVRTRTSGVIAQQYVEGKGAGYFALMRDGELRAEFAHRRIRDVRPTGSGSAVRESLPVDQSIRDAGLAVLRALRWHGPAMVEFRIRSDGTPVFMEVNGRFWHSLALPVAAGCDFPALTAALAEHGDIGPPPPYRTGVRCRWLLGDARHLVEVLRGPPPTFQGVFPSRLRTLVEVLMPVPGTHHDNFQWSDPLPEVGDWLDFFLRRLRPSRTGHRQHRA